MNIAYIITSLAQQGPANVVMDLVKLMQKNGHTCTVFYFDKKEKEMLFPCETVQIAFSEKIDFNKYDLVHTHSLRPDLYAFLRKPIGCKTPLVCTIHNFVFKDLISDHGVLNGILGGIIWQIARLRNSRILVLNKIAYKYYSKWFSKSKLRVAYNTRVLDYSQDADESDKLFISGLHKRFSTVCCSICRVTDRKGLNQIIEALPYLDETICFLIIGDGHGLQRLKDLAERLKCADRVFCIGERSDGYRYMPYIDVFCIPSHSEGFPLAMLEAASYGKAIVSSDIPVFKEIFSEEIVICKENDVESFVLGIKKVIQEKDALGMKAKEKFEQCYSPEAFYDNHIAIYKDLLK